MAVNIQIPTALRQFTEGAFEVDVEAATVGDALDALTGKFPDLRRHLFTENQTLRSFVNIYIGDTDIRQKQGVNTVLAKNDTLLLVPSIAGGSSGSRSFAA